MDEALPLYTNKDFFINIQFSLVGRFKPRRIGDRYFSAIYRDSELLHGDRCGGAFSNAHKASPGNMAVDDISILNVSQKLARAADI